MGVDYSMPFGDIRRFEEFKHWFSVGYIRVETELTKYLLQHLLTLSELRKGIDS